MKCIALVIFCALIAGPLFAADNDMATLKATMEAAASQRSTGATLTILGGVFLGAGLVSYVVGYFIFAASVLSNPYAVTGTSYIIWLAASIGAMALGGVGLGIGIPFLIIGNVRYNHAQQQMKEQSGSKSMSWEPFIGIDPLPFRFKAGITASF